MHDARSWKQTTKNVVKCTRALPAEVVSMTQLAHAAQVVQANPQPVACKTAGSCQILKVDCPLWQSWAKCTQCCHAPYGPVDSSFVVQRYR